MDMNVEKMCKIILRFWILNLKEKVKNYILNCIIYG